MWLSSGDIFIFQQVSSFVYYFCVIHTSVLSFARGLSIWKYYVLYVPAGAHMDFIVLNDWDPSHSLLTKTCIVCCSGNLFNSLGCLSHFNATNQWTVISFVTHLLPVKLEINTYLARNNPTPAAPSASRLLTNSILYEGQKTDSIYVHSVTMGASTQNSTVSTFFFTQIALYIHIINVNDKFSEKHKCIRLLIKRSSPTELFVKINKFHYLHQGSQLE